MYKYRSMYGDMFLYILYGYAMIDIHIYIYILSIIVIA